MKKRTILYLLFALLMPIQLYATEVDDAIIESKNAQIQTQSDDTIKNETNVEKEKSAAPNNDTSQTKPDDAQSTETEKEPTANNKTQSKEEMQKPIQKETKKVEVKKATPKQETAESKNTCANVETSNFSCTLKNGKVYVKGINSYGQLGLNISNYNFKQQSEEAIPYLPNISKITYSDHTLYMYSGSNIYLVGKNGFNVATSSRYKDTLLKKVSTKSPQLIQGSKSNPHLLIVFTNNTLKYKNYQVNKGNNAFVRYYSNNSLKASYDYYYHSNKKTSLYYYKNNQNQKEYRTYYNTKGQKYRYLKHAKVYNKRKVTHDYRYTNNVLRASFIYTYHSNGKKKQYNVKKYAANKRYTSVNSNKYHRNGKKSYYYLATYDARAGIRLGTTKTYYNKKGQTTYSRAKIDGIKYFSQHDGRWGNSYCNSGPYVGPFNNNGCMISSFSMMHSRYNKNITPLKVKNNKVGCNLNYKSVAAKYGYKVQISRATGGFTRNANTKFTNPKRYAKTGKTFRIKDVIRKQHLPVQVWVSPQRKIHRGHSVLAYDTIYRKGKGETVYIYDPYVSSKRRTLQSLSNNQYISRAQIYLRK